MQTSKLIQEVPLIDLRSNKYFNNRNLIQAIKQRFLQQRYKIDQDGMKVLNFQWKDDFEVIIDEPKDKTNFVYIYLYMHWEENFIYLK